MKFYSIIIVFVILIAAPALAYDLTYFGPLKAKEARSLEIQIPKGKSIIDVSSTNDSPLNCKFGTSFGLSVLQNNKCKLYVLSDSLSHMSVEISNPLDKSSDYKIWVHD